MTGKLIIFSAPSGSGKTTIVKHLLGCNFNLGFSVSATSRPARGTETDGIDYFFLSPEAFKQKIDAGDFLEWEEVYPSRYYGTLKSEVEKLRKQGINVVFDVDVVGGCNIKKYYNDQALSVFIQPPSIEALEQRLNARSTDSPDVIATRVAKAAYEMTFAPQFDAIIINDLLEKALIEAENIIKTFLEKP
jgi:guanylate kinase